MSNKKPNDRRLEAFKIFPYVAWSLTLIFTCFVYNIVMDLREVTTDLQAQTDYLKQQVNVTPDKIKNFEGPSQ